MSETKTTLQKLATPANRQAILRMLKEKKNIEQIAVPFDLKGDGGIDFIIDVLEAALLPEIFENLPPFDKKTRTFSDEAFAKELSFLNHPIESDEFTDKELAILVEKNITKYWQLLSMKVKIKDENFFSFPIEIPVVFTEKQRAQLIE